MDETTTLTVYTDYKSPYAFLAKDLIYEVENAFAVHVEWLPYTLDIPSYLGSARLDERASSSNRRATHINGAECVTPTWTAAGKRISAGW